MMGDSRYKPFYLAHSIEVFEELWGEALLYFS